MSGCASTSANISSSSEIKEEGEAYWAEITFYWHIEQSVALQSCWLRCVALVHLSAQYIQHQIVVNDQNHPIQTYIYQNPQQKFIYTRSAEIWNTQSQNIVLSVEVPRIISRRSQSVAILWMFTFNMLDHSYIITEWFHVHTDRSSDAAIRSGGSGIYIHYPNRHVDSHRWTSFCDNQLWAELTSLS